MKNKKNRLLNIIHKQNPYTGFPLQKYKLDLQGWGSDSEIFDEVIKKYKPKIVIEVGTWKGASAIRMASLAQKNHLKNLQIVCVDTWLGSEEHWLRRHSEKDWFSSLKLKNGYPSLFYQFLANVLLKKLHKIIVPLPLDSRNASLFLKKKKVVADVVYLDAGHDYSSVKADLQNYWAVVKKGGLLFGDDYVALWPGVIRAVNEFSEEIGYPYKATTDGKWFIQK